MSHDVSQIESSSRKDLTNNPQYQKLQKELKAKTQQEQDVQKKQIDDKTKIQKPDDTAAATRQSVVAKLLADSQDNVSLSPRFVWKKNQDGEMDVALNPAQKFLTNVKTDGKQVLKILGFKIDFSQGKVNEFKEAFMQNVIQARSDNFLLSKYGQFKVGALGTMLTLLGVSAEELKTLQEEALKGAIHDNIALMEQSLYDDEVMTVVGTKKSKKATAMMAEIRMKLTVQMEMLGNKGYWSSGRILEERQRQVGKIGEEFKKETENLRYLADYISQVGG